MSEEEIIPGYLAFRKRLAEKEPQFYTWITRSARDYARHIGHPKLAAKLAGFAVLVLCVEWELREVTEEFARQFEREEVD